jgi:[histone H3]-lysine4 N-trimethyltransferase SETD1
MPNIQLLTTAADFCLTKHVILRLPLRPLSRSFFAQRNLFHSTSLIHGTGLFTNASISAGSIVAPFDGDLINNSVADAREHSYLRKGILSTYMFRLNEQLVVDATNDSGCIARFANHSCAPNMIAYVGSNPDTGEDEKIEFWSARDIAAWEELTLDYHFEKQQEGDHEARLECYCRADGCIQFLN